MIIRGIKLKYFFYNYLNTFWKTLIYSIEIECSRFKNYEWQMHSSVWQLTELLSSIIYDIPCRAEDKSKKVDAHRVWFGWIPSEIRIFVVRSVNVQFNKKAFEAHYVRRRELRAHLCASTSDLLLNTILC